MTRTRWMVAAALLALATVAALVVVNRQAIEDRLLFARLCPNPPAWEHPLPIDIFKETLEQHPSCTFEELIPYVVSAKMSRDEFRFVAEQSDGEYATFRVLFWDPKAGIAMLEYEAYAPKENHVHLAGWLAIEQNVELKLYLADCHPLRPLKDRRFELYTLGFEGRTTTINYIALHEVCE